jgi:hypothetical protein
MCPGSKPSLSCGRLRGSSSDVMFACCAGLYGVTLRDGLNFVLGSAMTLALLKMLYPLEQ